MSLNKKINYFLKYLLFTRKKLINFLLCKISKRLKLIRPLGYPSTLMIEPTNICNLKCPLCPTGAGLIKRKKGYLSFSDFKKVVDEIKDHIFHLRLWNWGEPLLNKEIFKFISYAKSKKIFVNLSTNSSFLDEEITKKIIYSGLDELIISLDGASDKTYNQYRKGGNFQKVLKAIESLVFEKNKLHKQTPHIKLQFILMKNNEHEIEKIKRLAKKIGVDELVFKTVGIMDYFSQEDIKKYLPSNKKYSRYDFSNGTIASKIFLKNSCDSLWEETVVNWDGEVVPCCFDMNNIFSFGNAFSESIKSIWRGQKYSSFRKLILTKKSKIPLCKNCPGTNKKTFIKVNHNNK